MGRKINTYATATPKQMKEIDKIIAGITVITPKEIQKMGPRATAAEIKKRLKAAAARLG